MHHAAALQHHSCCCPGNSVHSADHLAAARAAPHSTASCAQPSPVSRRRQRCCHAVSKQQQQFQPAAIAPAGQQQQHPLVERMFDHNWRSPLAGHDHPDPSCRPVLALGKFDALHKGHQALAAAALQLGGTPVLLSFSGMAAVLGWAPRKPLVAPCDRPRVLDLWAQQLAQQRLDKQQRQARRRKRALAGSAARTPGSSQGSSGSSGTAAAAQQQQQPGAQLPPQAAVPVVPVRQRYIPFAAIRSLSPEAFVDHIAKDFRAAGVVSGGNYRFGYRAAGDAALLQQLCGAAGLPVAVVEMVGAATPGAVGPVSSTKIREMLDSCRMEAVKRSLGRPYRLVGEVNLAEWQQQQLRGYSSSSSSSSSSSNPGGADVPLLHPGSVFVPSQQLLNQHPAAGVFLCDLQLFVGASAHDDLLVLQHAVQEGADISTTSSSSRGGDAGASGSSSSSSGIQVLPVGGSHGCKWCVRAGQQPVEVDPDGGVLIPQAVWEAAESCLSSAFSSASNTNILRSQGSIASSSSSSSSSGRGTDPLVWDTDDRASDDEEEAGAEEGRGAAGMLSALLVLDIQSCLMQVCTYP